MWFIGVEVEQEKSAPPPKKNPGSAPGDFVSGQFVISKKPNDLAFFQNLEDISAFNLDLTLLTPLQPLSLTGAN